MSKNLKRMVKKLLLFTKLKKSEVKVALKKLSRNFINALSEIALNVREGIVKAAGKIKNSTLVKKLSLKTVSLETKRKLLRAAAAPIIVQALVSSVIAILEALKNG